MNYHLLSKNTAPLCLKESRNPVFFTTDRTIGRDAKAIFAALGMGAEDEDLRFARPHQTHTDRVLHVEESFFSLSEEEREAMMEGVDAVVSDMRNVCLGISTADCIPVLVYDKEHHAMAAIHAGWRGTVKRIVEKAVAEMQRLFGMTPEECEAVIGPGISQQSFEVGWEVHQAFVDAGFLMDDVTIVLPANDGGTSDSRANDGSAKDGRGYDSRANDGSANDGCGMKPHLDLKEINRRQLLSMGLKAENVMVSDIDTFTDERYFSARREQKGCERCGRILSGFWSGEVSGE